MCIIEEVQISRDIAPDKDKGKRNYNSFQVIRGVHIMMIFLLNAGNT